jgi:hypothetical protein
VRPTVLVFALLAVPACAATPEPKSEGPPGQSFPAAITMICDVDKLAGLSPDAEPLAVGQKRSAWLNDHIESPDAIELKTLMSVKGATDQAKMIREQAKAHGVKRCAFADSLDQIGSGGLSP